jgi:hypothetical protein
MELIAINNGSDSLPPGPTKLPDCREAESKNFGHDFFRKKMEVDPKRFR